VNSCRAPKTADQVSAFQSRREQCRNVRCSCEGNSVYGDERGLRKCHENQALCGFCVTRYAKTAPLVHERLRPFMVCVKSAEQGDQARAPRSCLQQACDLYRLHKETFNPILGRSVYVATSNYWHMPKLFPLDTCRLNSSTTLKQDDFAVSDMIRV
jgi:hypothetical protein